MRVYLTRELPGDLLDRIRGVADLRMWDGDEPVPRDVLLAEVAGADALCSMLTDTIDAELLDRAPDLRLISQMSVGIDNIDVAACQARGIRVGHTPDVLTDTVADHAFGLMLAAAHRFAEGWQEVEEGRWGSWDPWHMLGVDVHHTTLGIVGMGRVGSAVARRAAGFDMTIVYTSPRASGASGSRLPFAELLRSSDHVVITAPLNEQTRGMFDQEAFASMKSSATLVNVARGPLVDHDALFRALADGQIFAAALDVTDPEPLPATHPLAGLRNCLIVPHTGSATERTRHAMAVRAVDNLVAWVEGREMPSEVHGGA